MSKFALLLGFGFLFIQLDYVYSYPEIKNFSNKDPIFSDLRRKIAKYNRKESVPLFIYLYRVRESDTFFKIVNKVNGWQAGISTINLLNSPFLKAGKEILIPSKKGLFILNSKEHRFNSLLLATRDLTKAEKIKVKRDNKVYEFYFFDSIKQPKLSFLSSTEILFFLNADFIFPLKKFIISSDFGFRADPFTGMGSFHTGIDLSASINSLVFCTSYGVVIEVGYNDIYGNFVLIEHKNSIKSLYGHLNSYIVKKGDILRTGDIIGKVGQTGRSTGPHLHFEILKKNLPVNPIKILN
ncbi:LysM peptidoglycan-binding domain-containing M23 family metallopeptidase [Borrelia miyamotoi]|uniref:M23 family metallopeptidase n=1 Tax=Borrelia miyamotoi TaxID=47466 RepID=A0AAQ3AFR8_9SPIR|nr:peptidoglycan DD-metalloendopeptidase family protein [Borrelia miyamotoi]AGT27704.1 peptidoglycan-binding protein [Borrelia miyamotoi LB-2001]AJA58858.1 peptidoglycan-binding protein [Borrelia miyamotoi]AOW95947.1 peptidoglycan-binding protein [Borrelia miyamotoi]QTL83839.1 M23 family metallopeptidase [Borrelia miyamotoi]WAZ84854.1 M23 family metallopeptidase [Borrelia miyamotoi]